MVCSTTEASTSGLRRSSILATLNFMLGTCKQFHPLFISMSAHHVVVGSTEPICTAERQMNIIQ